MSGKHITQLQENIYMKHRQSVQAGHQGLSDFTRPNTAITIDGEPGG